MLLALVLLGSLGFFWGMGMAIRDGRKGASEAGVVGAVTDFEMREEAPTADHCEVHVAYTYEVDGQTHSGSAIQRLDRYKAEQACAGYGAGTLLVFHDPTIPAESWLESRSGNVIVPMLVAGLGAAVAGSALVFYTAS